MKTKYRVSIENTYLDPIASVSSSFFEDLRSVSTQTDRLINDANNNVVYSNLYYECRMKSSLNGEIRFHAGHYKHAFRTFGRTMTCKVMRGQMKVKCGDQKWKVTEKSRIKLNPNANFFVKNNSLRNECVVKFEFEQN